MVSNSATNFFILVLSETSVLECTYSSALRTIQVLNDYDVPVLAGGIFATFGPDIMMSHKCIQFVCIGEGEEAMIECWNIVVRMSLLSA